MSTIARSGSCASTAASSESKSPASAADLDAGGLQHARDPFAQQQRVLADHDPHGITPRTRVPPPGGLSTTSVPSSAASRSAIPRSPEPAAGSAPPAPSSAISIASAPS